MFSLALAALAMLAQAPIAAAQMSDAQAKVAARRSIVLWDELQVCSTSPRFRTYGLARGGPCGNWIDRVKRESDSQRGMIERGYDCLAGDVMMAGMSMVSGDRQHVRFVRGLMEECRRKVGPSQGRKAT